MNSEQLKKKILAGWRLFVDTANPKNTRNEILTEEEVLKQAQFESIDYHKPYPTMYMQHLRDNDRQELRNPQAVVSSTADEGVPTESSDGTSAGSWMPNWSDHSAIPRNAASAILEEVTAYDSSSKNSTLRWLLHVLIGIAVGFVAFAVSFIAGTVEDWRSYTLYRIVITKESRSLGYFLGFCFWVMSAAGFVLAGTAVVVFFEPAAGGSGIPDVIAYLNGVLIPKVMNFRTFVAKTISCICAVSGGLPVGVEAPLIHLGAIAGAGVTQGRSRTLGCQTKLFQAFRNNKDRRDFITAGAACGVSAAFGAPIGGLLFVMEEVSSLWDHSASGQIFLASMIAYSCVALCNNITKTIGRGYVSSDSLLFEVNVSIPLNLTAVLPAAVLGVICGLLAAAFTKVNLIIIRYRRANIKPFLMMRFLEPVVIVILFSSIMYILALIPNCVPTRQPGTYNETTDVQPWQTENVSSLVNMTCHAQEMYSPLATLNLGMGKGTIRHMFTRRTVDEFPAGIVFLYFIIYTSFACYTSGTFVASGLVVPTLVIGSTVGRMFGLFLVYGFSKSTTLSGSYFARESWMDPGVFALIGAGAFLGGISRMTMSISVIMVELSGELHYLLPIMVAIVVSKTTADWLAEPLYHQQLHLDFVPYLPLSIGKEFEQLTAADVMKSNVITLRMRESTSVIMSALRSSTHHAFPVVALESELQLPHKSKDGTTAPAPHGGERRYRFVGLVTREDIHVYLSLPALQHYAVNKQLEEETRMRESTAVQAPAPPDVFAEFDNVPVAAAAREPAAATAEPLSPSRFDADDADGYGGRLHAVVKKINKMTWTEWMTHQTSLFFVIGSKKWHTNWGKSGRSGTLAPSGGVDEALLPPVVDLSLIVSRSPWVVPPFFNLNMTYSSFRHMGLRHLVVVDGDDVKGIITRKELLVNTLKQRLQELHSKDRGPSVAQQELAPSTRRVPKSAGEGANSSAPGRFDINCSLAKNQRLLHQTGSDSE